MSAWEGEYNFWGEHPCDGLFLLFDTSAHVNNGEADVSADEVMAHILECETCREHDTRVSILADGSHSLEWS